MNNKANACENFILDPKIEIENFEFYQYVRRLVCQSVNWSRKPLTIHPAHILTYMALLFSRVHLQSREYHELSHNHRVQG